MRWNAGCQRGQIVFGIMGVLALVALTTPSAEARARVRFPSVPRPRSAPSVSVPRVLPRAPEVPKGQITTPAARAVPTSVPAVAPSRRGVFGRFWDWLLGRKPAPQPALQVARAVGPPTPAAAPATPGIPLPIPSVRVTGAPRSAAPQATGQAPGQEAQRAAGRDGASKVAATALGTAGGGSLAATLQQSVGKLEAQAEHRSAAKAAPKPAGYVIHLINGRSIRVASYEEKGDQVMIGQRNGSYGFPRSAVARIETQEAEPEIASTGRGAR